MNQREADAEAEVTRVFEEFGELYEELHEDHLPPEIEEDVAEIFEDIGPESVPQLVGVIEDGEPWAMRCAIRGLGRLGGDQATRALIETLERDIYFELVGRALERIGPSGIPLVIDAVDDRIENPDEAPEGSRTDAFVREGLRVIGNVRCEQSSTYLIELLEAVAVDMAAAPYDADKEDLKYAEIEFSQLLDSIVKQGDEAAIEPLETARDAIPSDSLEFVLYQIALGRLRLGETDEGYLPMESMDIMMSPGSLMGALTGEEFADEDFREREYGKYFTDVDPPW